MSEFVQKELELVKQKCQDIPGAELIACVPVNVRVKITRTPFKNVIVIIQFPEEYPQEPAIVEIKSRSWSQKLCEGLEKVVEVEAKKLVGQRMVLPILRFVRGFIDDNPLCVCSEEIHQLKNTLIGPQDECKLKQKAAQVILRLRQDRYEMEVKLIVGDLYPEEPLTVELLSTNYPRLIAVYLLAQAKEIARRCVTPPLKKNPKDPPFKVTPALLPVCEFLVTQVVRGYTNQKCPCCKKPSLPPNPEDITNDGAARDFVDRTFCQHLFHHGCLDKYMKTPPFTGGKKCPACGARIYHNSWNVTPQLAEARWAHQEARRRELEEVVDFLQ